MKRPALFALAALALMAGGVLDSAQCGHRIGGGIHYMRTLGDIKDAPGWDENAVALMASYQFAPPTSLFRIEGDVEYVLDYGGSGEDMIEPQAWLLVGRMLYASAGIGIGYIDGDWLDDPFYALRAGVDLGLGGIHLDCFASYRFLNSQVFDDIDQDDLDTVTFGVVARFGG
jgi:hypothetical protein